MGYVDIHCHVLPGVDDGAQTLEESLEMLRIAAASGISHMILTPHYKKGRVGIPRERLGEEVSRLQAKAWEQGIDITLYPGTEIYYSSTLEDKLESGWLARMNDSEYVLVEFSPMESFSYIRNALEDIFSLGYHPILAHVERYRCMLGSVENVRSLHDMGCQIQVNAGSIAGEYGFTAKHFIKKLLKNRLVEYLGTDAHNTGNRKPDMAKCARVISKTCDEEYAERLLGGNAREYLGIASEEGHQQKGIIGE